MSGQGFFDIKKNLRLLVLGMWLNFSENEIVTVTLTLTGGRQVCKEIEPIQYHFMVSRLAAGLSTQIVNDASIQTPSSFIDRYKYDYIRRDFRIRC
mgnify:CR=1 FL=1